MGDSRYPTQSIRLRRLRATARTRTVEMTLHLFIHSYADDSIEPYWL